MSSLVTTVCYIEGEYVFQFRIEKKGSFIQCGGFSTMVMGNYIFMDKTKQRITCKNDRGTHTAPVVSVGNVIQLLVGNTDVTQKWKDAVQKNEISKNFTDSLSI